MPSFGLSFRCAIQRASYLVFLASVLSAAFGQAADPAGTLPEDYLPELKGILQAALKQAPDVMLKELQIAKGEARVIDADRHKWPDLGGNIRYDVNQTAVSGNSNTQSRNSGLFYGISANKSVFYWGENKNRSEIARIELAIRGKEYADAYRILALQLRRMYLELIVRNASLRHARYDLTLRENAIASARVRRDNGTVSPGLVTGMEFDYNERQAHVERLQLEFDVLRRRIGRMAGIGEIPAESVPHAIPEPRYDAKLASELLAGMLRDGGRSTFEAQVAELAVRRAELNYRIAKVRLLPKFDASLEHSRESSTNASENALSQTAITRETAGIRGNWRIFDGFATKAAKLDARIEKRESEKRLQLATEAAVSDAQQAERGIAITARYLHFADLRRWGAEESLNRATAEMKEGRASQENVDGATNALREQEANTASARANFLAEWAAYVSLVTYDPVLNNLPPRYARAAR